MDGKEEITIDYSGLFVSGVAEDGDFIKAESAGKIILEKLKKDISCKAFPLYESIYDSKVVAKIEAVLNKIGHAQTMIVIGMGGSSLGARALESALARGNRELRFIDNTDPDRLSFLLSGLDFDKTVVNVVTKSGGTVETLANFLIIEELFRSKTDNFVENIIVTTDSAPCSLTELAEKKGYELILMPENVGGRFSIFTAAGLLPAAFVGVGIERLLDGAKNMAQRCLEVIPGRNPAFITGWSSYFLNKKKGKSVKVIMPYADKLLDSAYWYSQLWAESLGKRYDLDGNEVFAGQTPLVARGASDQHSLLQLFMEGPKDKVVCFLEVENFENDVIIPLPEKEFTNVDYLGGTPLGELFRAEKKATEYALSQALCPSLTVSFPVLDDFTMGQYLYLSMYETIIAGAFYNINPYDQPGVENGKKAGAAMMGKKGLEKLKSDLSHFFSGKERRL